MLVYASFFFHSATSHIQSYQIHDVSVGGQCALNVSCTVRNRTVATGCVFMYDSNGDGTLDDEILIGLPTRGNTAEHHLIIDCNPTYSTSQSVLLLVQHFQL